MCGSLQAYGWTRTRPPCSAAPRPSAAASTSRRSRCSPGLAPPCPCAPCGRGRALASHVSPSTTWLGTSPSTPRWHRGEKASGSSMRTMAKLQTTCAQPATWALAAVPFPQARTRGRACALRGTTVQPLACGRIHRLPAARQRPTRPLAESPFGAVCSPLPCGPMAPTPDSLPLGRTPFACRACRPRRAPRPWSASWARIARATASPRQTAMQRARTGSASVAPMGEALGRPAPCHESHRGPWRVTTPSGGRSMRTASLPWSRFNLSPPTTSPVLRRRACSSPLGPTCTRVLLTGSAASCAGPRSRRPCWTRCEPYLVAAMRSSAMRRRLGKWIL
mmetsp:Transcript_18594/g.58841  ORF Transcript_18594/g.58841 Transcript_18594/m.58841 type:complete len:335 (-) Transcript_18594:509-1513(-)